MKTPIILTSAQEITKSCMLSIINRTPSAEWKIWLTQEGALVLQRNPAGSYDFANYGWRVIEHICPKIHA